jgi:hypothetical protein
MQTSTTYQEIEWAYVITTATEFGNHRIMEVMYLFYAYDQGRWVVNVTNVQKYKRIPLNGVY